MRSHLLLSFALAVGAAAIPRSDLRAQSGTSVALGERIRLTTVTDRGRHRQVGRVVSVGVDSLTLDADVAGTRVAISNITGIEASGGRRTNGRRGMGYGLLAGSVIGAVVGVPVTRQGEVVPCPPDDYNDWNICIPHRERVRSMSRRAGAIVGGLLGVAIGGIGGRFYHTERWIGRTLGNGSLVGVAPARGGAMTVSVSMHF